MASPRPRGLGDAALVAGLLCAVGWVLVKGQRFDKRGGGERGEGLIVCVCVSVCSMHGFMSGWVGLS